MFCFALSENESMWLSVNQKLDVKPPSRCIYYRILNYQGTPSVGIRDENPLMCGYRSHIYVGT